MRRPPYEAFGEKTSRVKLENQIAILPIIESESTLAPMAMRTEKPSENIQFLVGVLVQNEI